MLSIAGSLYQVAKLFPIESLICAAVIAFAVAGVLLYMWNLAIMAWLVEFVSQLGVPKLREISAELEYEKVGEIIVVRLADNIATGRDGQAVEKRLKELIYQQHCCNLVLDFLNAGRISVRFRDVIISLTKATNREALKSGKPSARAGGIHLMSLPRPPKLERHGEEFRVFDDRQAAIEEISRLGGQGWVALCCVPVGTRAVFG